MFYQLNRRIHTSWLIAFSCVGIFLGVVIAGAINVGFLTTIGWLLTGIALCLFSWVKQRRYMILLALVGGLLIGAWRGEIEQSALTIYKPLIGKTVTLKGVVSEDSDLDKNGHVTLRLKNISVAQKSLPGKIWVSLNVQKSPVQRSDTVTIQGQVSEGFGTFSASVYRANLKKIDRPEPGDIALKVRNWFADAVRTAIPEPEASLGVGYLVGQRRNLPEQLDMSLRIAGLTHIVVASGYNLTILIRLARRLFEKVSKYLSALVSGGLILSFIAITGLSPSMSRAGLVAGISLAAWYYGRRIHPLVLLPFAIALTVLFNPSYAWGDVGWQLSFAAFGGVMLLAPLLQRFYFGDRPPGIIRQILGETISAWLCTLPILIATFGYISNVAIFANLLILPLVPLAMLLVFIAGLGALLIPAFATVIGFPAHVLLGYMVQTTEFMANLSWAKSDVMVGPWLVALLYSVLILFGMFMWWRTKLDFRQTNIIE